MSQQYIKPEVLAPAGDIERFIAALNFGADAIYLGGEQFGMRAAPTNFDMDTLREATKMAHDKGVKVYLTCNTVPKNYEIEQFPEYIKNAYEAGIDAAIVSDIGTMMLVKKYAPELEIHISTQAGIVNYVTANAFYEMGAKRVVLARELSLEEITEICEKTPKDLEIEVFVHGAMCMSFSGRCLLSSYMTGRDANRGECAQPCRWGYYLVEEKRPGEYYRVEETDKGSYILNAKDMCMIEHIDKLIKAGVTSLKIEGRAKSSYYVAVVTNAYRMAVDDYLKDPENYKTPDWLVEEVTKVSHRQYTTGFFFGQPENGQYYENGGYLRNFDVIATVDGYQDGYLIVTQKNRFKKGDVVEILEPNCKPFEFTITQIINDKGEEIDISRHPMATLKIPCDRPVAHGAIVRKDLTLD